MGPWKSQKSKSSHYMPWGNKDSYFTIYPINMSVLVTLCCYDKISCLKKPQQFKEERVYIRLQLQKGRIHHRWRRHGSRSRKERDYISFTQRKKETWTHEPSQTISNDVIPPARPHILKIGSSHTVFLDMHYVIIIITSISKALYVILFEAYKRSEEEHQLLPFLQIAHAKFLPIFSVDKA